MTCVREGRRMVTGDFRVARGSAREGRYAVAVAPPRPPIVQPNGHDLTISSSGPCFSEGGALQHAIWQIASLLRINRGTSRVLCR